MNGRRTGPTSAAVVTTIAMVLAGLWVGPAHGAVATATALTATGQELSISIDAPAQAHAVLPGQTVTVSGTAAVQDLADVTSQLNAIYVIDASSSTTSFPGMNCDGVAGTDYDNFNGDARIGDILDCELHAIHALNTSLEPRPNTEVGVVAFAQYAAVADTDPADGDQLFSPPGGLYVPTIAANIYRSRVRRVLEGVVAVDPYFTGAVLRYFTLRQGLGGSTSYEQALVAAETLTAQTPNDEMDVVYFLSDGMPTPTSSPWQAVPPADTALNRMVADGVRFQTYSVGPPTFGPGCASHSPLLWIAQRSGGSCTVVTDPAAMAAEVARPTVLDAVEVAVDGVVTAATIDPDDGTWTADIGGLAPGEHTIRATALASDGTTASAQTAVVGVHAPSVDAGGPYDVDEGSTVQLDATVVDADSTLEQLTHSWSPAAVFTDHTVEDPSFSGVDDDTQTVQLTVTDQNDVQGSGSAEVTVHNVDPDLGVVSATPATGEAGSPVAARATLTDAGALDTHTGTWDWGDGHTSAATIAAGEASGTHTYETVGTYTVTLAVTDDDGGGDSEQLSLRVTSPPQVTVNGPSAPLAIGTLVTVTGQAQGNGAAITDTQIDWDDGTTELVALDTAGAFTPTHRYAAPGIYTITVTATDEDGATATAAHEYAVVYDPDGGFVTGGGHLDSPAGAYAADPARTGRATFGFVAKYTKGKSTPSGDTQFQFSAGGLSFASTAYQWLVVSGSRAQYKGTGTVNGTSGYGFLLSAVDGSPDRLRIKIWETATDAVVYDNQMGAAEDATASQALAGGSIVIHTGGKK